MIAGRLIHVTRVEGDRLIRVPIEADGICPVCKTNTSITGKRPDGDLVGAYGDTFSLAAWIAPEIYWRE